MCRPNITQQGDYFIFKHSLYRKVLKCLENIYLYKIKNVCCRSNKLKFFLLKYGNKKSYFLMTLNYIKKLFP